MRCTDSINEEVFVGDTIAYKQARSHSWMSKGEVVRISKAGVPQIRNGRDGEKSVRTIFVKTFNQQA